MKTISHRAWKFHFPSFQEDESQEMAGITTTAVGGIEMISGDASIRQSILMLLSTSPGERVMFPEYGCNLRKLAFSENDDTTAGLAIHYIREAVKRWEPRIRIIRLEASANPHYGELLDISIIYRTVVSDKEELMELSIDLDQKRM